MTSLFFEACQPDRSNQANFSKVQALQVAKQAWDSLPIMLARIEPPSFKDHIFNVLDFGAKADSTFDSQDAIQAAIDSCHLNGGGKVIIPSGVFFSAGPLQLKSDVNLHLDAGAYLKFSDQAEDYLPLVKVRWEGTVCWNWSPLIYAYQAENIALTGSGTIDGNGQNWSKEWREIQKPEKDRLRQMGNDLVPEDERVFGNGFLDIDEDGKDDGFGDGKTHFLRPTLIEFYECKQILIADLKLKNSPFWTVHPVFSKNITIRGLDIKGGYYNDDGIDPDSCEDVLIEDCRIATKDDAIAIKAGRDQDAWNRPGSNGIIVRNCELNSGVNSFCIGSEMSGGVKNVFVENCQIKAGEHGLNFKCNLDRGGSVERIFFRDITVDTLKDALFIFRMDYHGYRGNHFPTQFSDFYASNIQCKSVGTQGFKIVGVPDAPIRRVFLQNITIDSTKQPLVLEHAENLIMDGVMVNGKEL